MATPVSSPSSSPPPGRESSPGPAFSRAMDVGWAATDAGVRPAGFGKTRSSPLGRNGDRRAGLAVAGRGRRRPGPLPRLPRRALRSARPTSATRRPARSRRRSHRPRDHLTALPTSSRLAGPIVLVLDDYHLVDSPPVDDAIAFLSITGRPSSTSSSPPARTPGCRSPACAPAGR